MEVGRVTGYIYSVDPGVDRYHIISNSSYHTTIPNLWSHSLCPRRWVIWYLLTWFLHVSTWNCNFSWIQFGCYEMCGKVLLVGSLPSSSIVSPQWPPSHKSGISLHGRDRVLLWLCSSTIRGPTDNMYVYRETGIMHGILWCCESSAYNKDK
jgi:hypothetical protein